jgi:TldD protein
MRVERYTPALHALLQAARSEGVFAIARVQDGRDRALAVNNGVLERVSAGQGAGLGVHVFTPDGLAGFASTDRVTPEEAVTLVRRAAELARGSAPLDPQRNLAVFALPAGETRVLPNPARALAATPLAEQSAALLETNRIARDLAQDFSVRSGHAVIDQEWRVVRSDGTDVTFATPHAYVRHDFTARSGAGAAATTGCAVSGADADVLLGETSFRRLQARARGAVSRARAVLGAPAVRSGSYRLVLDYALAKGLAHEAFGHASETDGAETSVLARDGRLRLGEEVAQPGVSVIDGPIEGDYAYQPISANGLTRQTVHIIRDGRLESGLGDLFSAAKAGSPITGAGRAESYRSRPLPRMSNIRIEVAGALDLDLDVDEVQPESLRDHLIAAALIAPGEPALFLSGYKGGQVNPKLGDFVFNCGAIFALHDGASARQPAVFSGKSLSALRAIRAGLGPLRLDAMGHCGKGGQSVPSSGGSHAFLVLDPHPDVVLGGV